MLYFEKCHRFVITSMPICKYVRLYTALLSFNSHVYMHEYAEKNVFICSNSSTFLTLFRVVHYHRCLSPIIVDNIFIFIFHLHGIYQRRFRFRVGFCRFKFKGQDANQSEKRNLNREPLIGWRNHGRISLTLYLWNLRPNSIFE